MKYTNEQYAEMIAALLPEYGGDVTDRILYIRSILTRKKTLPVAFESLCYRVHKALCDLTNPDGCRDVDALGLAGCWAYVYIESYGGRGKTHEEAILNSGMDWFKKEKQR